MLAAILAVRPLLSDPGSDVRITDCVYGLSDRLNTPGVSPSLNDLPSSDSLVAS